MERRVQDHRQEMEKLRQAWQLEKDRMVHDSQLKLEAEEVRTSADLCLFIIIIVISFCMTLQVAFLKVMIFVCYVQESIVPIAIRF